MMGLAHLPCGESLGELGLSVRSRDGFEVGTGTIRAYEEIIDKMTQGGRVRISKCKLTEERLSLEHFLPTGTVR